MAAKKYDLALVETKTDKPVKLQQWYKERLETKYLKNLKPGELYKNSSTQNWIFLKDGLDDFRDGLPPPVQGSDFIKPGKGSVPILNSDYLKSNTVKQPAAKKRLSKYQTYMSRITPQQYQRREYINQVEKGLLKHPLALYPHLEDSLAPDRRQLLKSKLVAINVHLGNPDITQKLFEDIVDLLDPQFNINEIVEDDIEFYGKDEFDEGSITEQDPAVQRQKQDDALLKEVELTGTKNLYRWVPRKENKKDGKKNKEKEIPWNSTLSEEEHMKQVTQEFCEWIADLGGETNNIEESTITSLFASGYETKPALSVPIHVVELTSVPQELRLTAVVPPPAPTSNGSVDVKEEKKKRITGDYEPSWVKFKYGAWYLHPKTWKKMGFDEPLEDPKQLKEYELSEAKKKSNELNNELATMHASKAFADFIERKSTRKPEFLLEVAEIQKRAEEEELKRIEAEQLSKQKKNNLLTKQVSDVVY
ncbi:protein FAM47E-like isoform X1 [Biomphalaria glabrata]|uniref:Protein FAM47E-like isoform X1 n=1 Tax=Biomphalaria glabrata TaxID=6526 RepID=A0A2C9M5W8_BIOGL|nr:protein FAM47E-like isoform X1 [Biomphalaria glabrata]KAI8757019.1 protein FAM47E-like isoform X1 [Biomphalaria glabrata]KAI8798489.1 protein FAM47E isoform X1 [Biomphalaria glabrata]